MPESELSELNNRCLEACSGLQGGYKVVFQAKVQYPGASAVMMRPAHCVQLRSGRYVQIIAPLVVGSSATRVSFIVCEFVAAASSNPKHPEINLPWLKRSGIVAVVDAIHVLHRVHVVPCFEGNQDTQTTYLVNKGYWRKYGAVGGAEGSDSEAESDGEGEGEGYAGGAADEAVYSVCPKPECVGRVKGPPKDGPHVEVECTVCGHSFRWG